MGGGGAVGDANAHFEKLTASATRSEAEPIVVEEVEMTSVPDGFPKQRYKPLSIIGRGANGVVYMARDRLLGKRVAIKMLQSTHNNTVIDFQREAKIASALNHPGIVRVLDFGADGGQPYLVMEFVRGCSLNDFISDNGPLSVERFVSVGRGLAEAVDHAHKHDIVHRDLKPENIIVPDDPSLPLVILDFGLARASDIGSNTVAGTIVGTPLYMSPEQAEGLVADWRADIYSLGAVFYFMLTGRPPLTEKQFQQCMVGSDPDQEFPIEPPTNSNSINKMIARMLQRNRSKRGGTFRTIFVLFDQAEREQNPRSNSITTSASLAAANAEIQSYFDKIERKKSNKEILMFATIVVVALAVPLFGILRGLSWPSATGWIGTSPIGDFESPEMIQVNKAPDNVIDDYKVGDSVECSWTGDWRKAKIINARYGKYLVQLEGGVVPGTRSVEALTDDDKQFWVGPEQIRH